jgi:glycosyltransferase involved in cell wall biosynthesis
LLSVFNEVRKTYPDLKLVMTGLLTANPEALNALHQLKLVDSVLFFPGISDTGLSFLYKNASALCLTSLMEGNFPPQIFEALEYKTPVVATRLPLIMERLNRQDSGLLLCHPSDLKDFVSNLSFALENRDFVIERQSQILEILRQQSSWKQFKEGMKTVVENLASPARSIN